MEISLPSFAAPKTGAAVPCAGSTWRLCRIPSVQLYRRLGIAVVEHHNRRRLPRWAGQVSRMAMSWLPRQLLTGFVASPRPAGSPLMTWGRTLKKALIKFGRSPSFAAWRQAAADRMFWWHMYGRCSPARSRKVTQAKFTRSPSPALALQPPSPPPRCGLNKEEKRQSASLTKTLHCTSARCAKSSYAREAETRKPQNRK